MARHRRAKLYSYHGDFIRYVPLSEAYKYINAKEARSLTSNKALRNGAQLAVQLLNLRRSTRVVATLTCSDSVSNAEAVVDNHGCRSRSKVVVWPDVYDTYAVTVAPRGIFIPSEKAAMERAKARLEERWKQVHSQSTSR
jgi:hypothetical protein